MKPLRSGAIVMTASTNSYDGEALLTAYNASKAGLLGTCCIPRRTNSDLMGFA